MPEIKHDFSAGKMNKDLDERIVPNGQYRDAINIQVRTTASDGGEGNAGTIQNLQGNKQIAAESIYRTCGYSLASKNETRFIGSVGNEKNNKAYFLIASPNLDSIISEIFFNPNVIDDFGGKEFIDYIVEVDTGYTDGISTASPVVVDRYAVIETFKAAFPADPNEYPSGSGWTKLKLKPEFISKIRVGMEIQVYNGYANEMLSHTVTNSDGTTTSIRKAEIQKIEGEYIYLYDAMDSVSWNTQQTITSAKFVVCRMPDRVLEFDNETIITGINIIDDLLFWTDNRTEPKKINIKRCKEGTAGFKTHTQLKLSDALDSDVLLDYVHQSGDDEAGTEQSLSSTINNDLKLEHVTVIRKAPLVAPTIEMSNTQRSGTTKVEEVIFDFATSGPTNTNMPIGTVFTLPTAQDILDGTDDDETNNPDNDADIFGGPNNDVNYRINDIIRFQENTYDTGSWVTCIIDNIEWVEGDDGDDYKIITFRLLTRNQDLSPTLYINDDPDNDPVVDGSGTWELTLVEKDPLFELVFGRFGIRYKYEDGEYSSFGPWSEIAFLPGDFDFDHKKGYNLGMANTMKKLVIKDFIPHQRVKPADVVALDILYKNTTSPNVYIVKTITKGIDPEWDNFITNTDNDTLAFGEMEITSEMIRRPLPNNQNLRSWDNVPRTALAQEITANRLLFSNYTQGYDVIEKPNLKQSLKNYPTPTLSNAQKSLKSIRDYKIGIVFGDRYGRETPVISPGFLDEKHAGRWRKIDGTIKVPKNFSGWKNTLELQQVWGEDPTNPGSPDSWISYVKYFIKETSNEYYNLVMDRWYPAEDGNIWLSFASADRNKLDEDTYIILKNEHGNDNPVAAKGRYKIIAIKNEAPDFIRQVSFNLGQVVLGTFTPTTDLNEDPNWAEYMWDGAVDPLNVQPTLLNTQTEIAISPGKWNNFISQDFRPEGDLQIRLKGSVGGEFFVSEWKQCTYWHTVEDENEPDLDGTGALRWDEPFNSNIFNLLQESQGGTIPLPSINWYLEFQEKKEKNKPEFDGKFFVKIEKDDVLKNAVLQTTGSQQSYTIQKTYEVSYIDNSEYNPGTIFNESFQTNYQRRSTYKWLNDSTLLHAGGNTDTDAGDSNFGGGNDDGGLSTAQTNTYNDVEVFEIINGSGVAENISLPVNAAPNSDTGMKVATVMDDFDDPSSWGMYWSNFGRLWRGEDGNWGGRTWCGNSSTRGCHPYDAEFMALGCWTSGGELYGASEDSSSIVSNQGWGGDSDIEDNVYNRTEETRGYWTWFQKVAAGPDGASMGGFGGNPVLWDHNSYSHKGRIFIDGMRTRETRFGPGAPAGSKDIVYDEDGTIIEEHSGSYYKPTGLDAGILRSTDNDPEPDNFEPTQPGHLGRVVFSMLPGSFANGYLGTQFGVWEAALDPSNGRDAEVTGFYNSMSTYGTLFRFMADPNAKVYKVVTTSDTKMDMAMSNYSAMITELENNCMPGLDGTGSVWQVSPYYANWTSSGVGGECAWSENPTSSNGGTPFCDDKWDCSAKLGWTNQNPKLAINSASNSPTLGYADGVNSFVTIGGIKQPNDSDHTEAPDNTSPITEKSSCQPCGRVEFVEHGVQGYSQSFVNHNKCIRTGLRIEFREFDMGEGKLVGDGSFAVDTTKWDPRSYLCHDGRESMGIAILGETVIAGTTYIPPSDPAIWETEPKEDVGLDIYYEASNAIPTKLTSENTPNFAPYHSKVTKKTWNQNSPGYIDTQIDPVINTSYSKNHRVFHIGYTRGSSIIGIESQKMVLTGNYTFNENQISSAVADAITYGLTDYDENYTVQRGDLDVGDFLVFTHPNGTKTMSRIDAYMEPLDDNDEALDLVLQTPTNGIYVGGAAYNGYSYTDANGDPTINHLEETRFRECETPTGFYKINSDVWKFPVELGWHNCWSFGNGVESDRIRDDYNAPQVDNGVKVSATLLDYGREIRGSGMIYSGIYNTTSATNKLNEFNMAEKITKDINPRYGTIQALKARDTDVVVFTEDKTLKVIANKDALYNADGNPQMIATDRVLGQVIPFSGDYGISKNPESLAWDQFRLYFTDKQRGAVLRLSQDGLTPISQVGMRTWFRENLRKYDKALGTFDMVNGEYNLTLSGTNNNEEPKTVSFNEESKGWVSFKSFYPQQGLSIGGKYLTAISENLTDPDEPTRWGMWQHYFDIGNPVKNRNTFYGEGSDYFSNSKVSVLFNDMPEVVKTFRTSNYDGSQAKVNQFTTVNKTDAAGNTLPYTDGEYYNLKPKNGWWLENIKTDLHSNERRATGNYVNREGRWFADIKGGRRVVTEDLDEFGVQGLGNMVEEPVDMSDVSTLTITFDSDYINDEND